MNLTNERRLKYWSTKEKFVSRRKHPSDLVEVCRDLVRSIKTW